MKKQVVCALVLILLVFPLRSARSQSHKMPANGSAAAGEAELPVSGYKIPMDTNAWKRSLSVVKTTYSEDDNSITFLVRAKRDLSPADGLDAIFEFLDEDGVNMVKSKNLAWEDPPGTLRANQATRVVLELPDEDTLRRTKKTRAVAEEGRETRPSSCHLDLRPLCVIHVTICIFPPNVAKSREAPAKKSPATGSRERVGDGAGR